MSTDEPGKPNPRTHWVIGAFAIIIFLIATYMNYGASLHLGAATDLSAVRIANNIQ